MVFDYQSSSDFKFAGLEIGTSKVQIGRRTAAGWQVLAQANWVLTPNRDDDVVVAVNGQVVTLYVDGVLALTYTFASPLVDPNDPSSGPVDPLTDGMVGVGSNGPIMRLGEMSVRTLAPTITHVQTEQFDTAPSGWSVDAGAWAVASGSWAATPGAGGAALATTVLGVAPTAVLIADTVVSTAGVAGLVFDYYAPDRFKFVVVDVATGRVVLGHRTAEGWFEDAVATRALSPSAPSALRIVLDGTTVTVFLDGAQVLVRTYASLLNDGRVGLLSRSGPASFASFTLQTDDPDLTPALPFASDDGGTVTVDATAAGWGWNTDPAAPSAGEMDLLTVVLHEIGHLLGYEHADGRGVMSAVLDPGVRSTRLPRGRR